jgi:hypothetical protein
MRILITLIITLVSILPNLIASDDISTLQKSDTTDTFYTTPARLVDSRGKIYINGQLLSKNEVVKILQSYPEINNQYLTGYKLKNTGNALLTTGIIGSVAGMAIMISGIKTETTTSAYSSETTMEFTSQCYVGLAVVAAFELMIPAGIITGIMGKNKVRAAVVDYNKTISGYSYKQPVKVEFGIVSSGIGLRVTF